MGPSVPRTTLAQFRKRRRISLDGRVPGVLYSRQRRSQQPGTVPIDRPASPGAPQTYVTFHPDAYEPHPGEAVLIDSHYVPYQAEAFEPAPDELGGHVVNAAHTRDIGPEIDSDHATFLRLRWFNDRLNQPAPDVIPAEHDVVFEGPVGPTVDISIDRAGSIDAIWSRVLNQPRHDAASVIDESFAQVMYEAIRPTETPDLPSAEELVADGNALGLDALVESVSGMPGQNDLPVHDEHSMLAADTPWDMVPSPGDLPLADCTHGGTPALEQIAHELEPLAVEPDPMMRDWPYPDEMLMDSTMMPGMGPMPPGLGLVGPMGPLGPIM